MELDSRIRIRAPLRCDGIGRLDCAEDVESGARLAVRWLPLDANGDAAARACERLPAHPTLPRIRQTGQLGGSAWVAMDFPEGQVLGTMLGERLDVDLVLRVAAQVADALATVHAQGVVHGELGAESVLLVPPDRAYLWDMPLVIANRLTDRRGENRLMHNLVRVAPFLAPERARGEGASQPGDVYSLGAVLCVAAGAPVPSANATLGVVHQVATGEWTPRVPLALPEPARGMLERMVSRNPTHRPTAREAAAVFSTPLSPAAVPTVPELPAIRLPPELQAKADALLKRPTPSPAPKVAAELRPADALKTPTLEIPRIVVPPEAFRPAEGAKGAAAPAAEAKAAEPKAAFDEAPAGAKPATSSGPHATPKAAATSFGPHAAPKMAATSSGPHAAPKMAATSSGPHAAPAAALASVPTPAVQLTDTISVTQELAAAGAVALQPDDLDAIAHARSTRTLWIVGSAMLGAVLALALVAVKLAASAPPAAATPPAKVATKAVRAAKAAAAPRAPAVTVPTPAAAIAPAQGALPVAPPALAPAAAPAVAAPVAATPTVAAPALEDELAPLPRLEAAPKAAPAKPVMTRPAPRSGSRAAWRPAAQPKPPATESAETPPVAAPTPAKADDFSFLESAPAPTSELKRPQL